MGEKINVDYYNYFVLEKFDIIVRCGAKFCLPTRFLLHKRLKSGTYRCNEHIFNPTVERKRKKKHCL